MPGRADDISPRVAGWAVAIAASFVVISRALYLTTSTNGPDSAVAVEQVYGVLFHGAAPLHELHRWTPIYAQLAALLAMIFDLFGPLSAHEGCRWASILVTSSSVVPMYWLARAMLGSRLGGITAVAFYAVMPLTWWFSGEMIPDAGGTAWLLWPFGLLAEWWHKREPRYVGLACLLMGASPLVHFVTGMSFLPLFLTVVLIGSCTRTPWRSVRVLPLLFVPALASLLVQYFVAPGLGLTALVRTVTPMALFGSDLTRTANPVDLHRMVNMALGSVDYLAAGSVGFWAAAVGAAAFLLRGPVRVALLALWIAPVIAVQLFLAQTAIRFYLPLMPVAAILIAAAPLALRRLAMTRPLSMFTAAALLVLVVGHAHRDLVTLSTRFNVLDAIPVWYRSHTPSDSLLLTWSDQQHVRVFSGRTARRAPEFKVEVESDPQWAMRVRTPLAYVDMIDRFLLADRPVYTHDGIPLESFHALQSHYELKPGGKLEGARLRNIKDPEFGWMGEGLKITRDLTFYQLTFRPTWPRSAPAPSVEWRVDDGEVCLVVSVDVPMEPGAACRLWLSRTADALDWTRAEFGTDSLLAATSAAENEDTRFVLDHAGKGTIAITRNGVIRDVKGPLSVAYAVLDQTGALRRISLTTQTEASDVSREEGR